MNKRSASVTRNTKETSISIDFTVDGSGSSSICTGIGFFDHMLDGFARHGLFDLQVKIFRQERIQGCVKAKIEINRQIGKPVFSLPL